MKNLLLSILTSIILFSCNTNEKKKTELGNVPCDCEVSNYDMNLKFPITANNDSIIICRKGVIEGKKWFEFMKNNRFNKGIGILNDELINCKTGEIIIDNHWNKILLYSGDSLIVYRWIEFANYDSINDVWRTVNDIKIYRETISASGDIVVVSPKKIILKPIYQSPLAFKKVDTIYYQQTNNIGGENIGYLSAVLLSAALCGDTISSRRLLNLTKKFEFSLKNNPYLKESIKIKVDILNDYNEFIQSGNKREYIDMTVYPNYNKKRE